MTTATTTADPDPVAPVLHRVEAAMKLLNSSRSVIYEQIHAGCLRTVKQGRSCRIPDSAIREYVALLEREAGGANDPAA